jgi:hypothetical protein
MTMELALSDRTAGVGPELDHRMHAFEAAGMGKPDVCVHRRFQEPNVAIELMKNLPPMITQGNS